LPKGAGQKGSETGDEGQPADLLTHGLRTHQKTAWKAASLPAVKAPELTKAAEASDQQSFTGEIMLTTPVCSGSAHRANYIVCIGRSLADDVHASTETGESVSSILPPVDQPSMWACSAALLGVSRGLLGALQ